MGDTTEEARLIARAQKDPRAFGQLYDQHVTAVYRYCYRRTSNHHDAEDLTSQTFRRALEALPAYRWKGAPFGAWLLRIAHNLLYDQRRLAGRSTSLEVLAANGSEPAADDEPPLEALLADEETHGLWATVRALPPLHQRVLVLRFAQGLSNTDVARLLNRSETATKQLVYRALKDLRARIEVRQEIGW